MLGVAYVAQWLRKLRLLRIVTALVSLSGAVACARSAGPAGRDTAVSADEVPDTLQSLFVTALAPHGEWFSTAEHRRVWRPHGLGVAWRPYSRGRWLYTDAGWTWLSSFAWGWAPFHYGRWFLDRERGWAWVPGKAWSPAWVTWREGSGYVGWAPLPPHARFVPSVGMQWPASADVAAPRAWSFVRAGLVFDDDLVGATEREPRSTTLIEHTSVTPINVAVVGERVVNRGLSLKHVRARVGRHIRTYALRDVAAPEHGCRLRGGVVTVFRP